MRRLFGALLVACLAGCATSPPPQNTGKRPDAGASTLSRLQVSEAGREIVMFALGLIDVGYQFGGKNPEAGLDCSGMVSFIYRNAINLDLRGSAADIAKRGRPINREQLQAGDLVFFNTLNRPFSHVGIFIGDGKFIHAPSSRGRIRIESMASPYFASRYEAARSYFQPA
ncbi:C40 family peptidase [Chitinimonas sp.]|uniref:C40 family peptidase n=1 Tax=Chitinimonas sp. TaxID=1934313 RepID=UPI0035B32977